MGKSSGWIYEGHAPLMAKRGRRGDKRRRLVGGVVILGLTLTVVSMTARTASGGSSPSAIDDRFDEFATTGARFGGGSRDDIHGGVRLHRFGSDAAAASAATRANRAMDSMNSLTVGAAADRGVEMMRDHRHHEPSHGGGLRTADRPIHLGVDDDVDRAVDFSHRPLVSHGGGWESQPLIESRIRHRDCGVSPAALAAATANDSPHVDASPADASRWFRRFWEPCVSCADEEQIGGEPVVPTGDDSFDDSPIHRSGATSADSESLGGRWVCDPERMIATPESDAEFKARVEQERRAARGAHGWLHSLGFGGGRESSGESSKMRDSDSTRATASEKVGCVVLTVGVDIANSRGGFAFERDMRALYGCEVHVFDAMAGATPPPEERDDDDDAFDEDGTIGGKIGAEKKPRATGGMTFTAGVSLASTSTAPTHGAARGGKRRRAAPLEDDDDEEDDEEEEDEEFRGESGDVEAGAKDRSWDAAADDDDDDAATRPRERTKQTTHSAFLSGGDSRPLTGAGAKKTDTAPSSYSMTLPEMIDAATRGSSEDGTRGGGHALVDVVRIACDGCELDALTTAGASRALKERVKQLLLEVRYVPGEAPFVVSASSRGGKKAESSFGGVDDGEDAFGADDADVADDDSSSDDDSSDASSMNRPTGTAGLWRALQVDAGMLPFHKEVEIVDVSREHHVGTGGSDPLRKGVTVKRKSVGFFGSLFGGGGGGSARGGRRGEEDLRPVVEYGLINERMVRKTKGRAGTRDW